MANAFDTIEPGNAAPNAFDTISPEKPRSFLGEVATGAKRGALVDLPRMVGKAIQYATPGNQVYHPEQADVGYEFGKGLVDSADARGLDPELQLRPEQQGTITNVAAGGTQMLVGSALPAVGAALATAPFGLGTAATLGTAAVAGSLPFAGQVGQETLEAAKEKEIPENKALEAARLNAGVSFGTNVALTLAGGQLFGKGAAQLGNIANKEAAPLASQTLAELTGSTGVLKPFAKRLALSATEGVAANAVQVGAEAAVNKAYGIDDKSPLAAAVESVPDTASMFAVLAPFGLAARAVRTRSLKARATALTEPTTNPEIRTQLANQYYAELRKSDPQAAIEFAKNADTAIQNNLKLDIDDGLFLRDAVVKPKPEEQAKLPAPDPIKAGAEVAPDPAQVEAVRQADQAAQDRATETAREENRRALVDTHEQIKTELSAAGVAPTQALTFADFVKSMKKEATKQKASLTQADFEDMYLKHQDDVMTANIRKAEALAPVPAPDVAAVSAGAPAESSLSVALRDAVRRKQEDSAYEQNTIARAIAKEKELNAIQNQTLGAEQLAAAEAGTLPEVTDIAPVPQPDVIASLKALQEDGKPLPSRLAQDVNNVLQGTKTQAEQIQKIKKLRDSKNTNSQSFQLLSQLHDQLNGGPEVIPDVVPTKTAVGPKIEPRTAVSSRGRKKGTTDDRHTIGDPGTVEELYPNSMTLDQARKDVGGIFTEKAWWQDLAWALRNPENKIAKELLDNGKFTDEQMGQALRKDERYQAQDKLIAEMSAEREALLRESILDEENRPEKVSRTDAQILKELMKNDGDVVFDKADSTTLASIVRERDVAGVVELVKNSKTLGELIPKLAAHVTRPELKQLISDLSRLNLETAVTHYDKIIQKGNGVTFGRYLPPEPGHGDAVVIARGGSTPETILHEAVHAAVWSRVSKAAWQKERVTTGRLEWKDVPDKDKTRISAMEDLLEIFHDAKALADKRGETHYGFSNIHEFISELTTNEALQKLLKTDMPKTLWARIVSTVKKILGLRMPETNLDKAMSLSKEFYGSAIPANLNPADASRDSMNMTKSRPATFDHFVSSPDAAEKQTDGVLGKLSAAADKIALTASPILTKAHLAVTTMNHIRQTYKRLLPGLETHVDAKDRVEATVKERNHAAQRITEEMAKLSEKDQRVLYDLMGESTRKNIFPNRTFEEQAWLKPEDRAEHRRLSQEYNSSPEIKKAYDQALEHNKQDYQREYAAILRNIGYLNNAPDALWRGVDPKEGASTKAKALENWLLTEATDDTQSTLRSAMAFHQQRINSPYFHLGRNGEYFTRFTLADTPEARAAFNKTFGAGLENRNVVKPDDLHVFARYENNSEWQAVARKLQTLKDAGHVEEFQRGKLQKNLSELDSTAPSFVRSMMAKIDVDTRLNPEQKEQSKALMRRLYVEMLPETSASKAFAKRQGVAGYDADLRRSFAKRAQASSFFVAHNTVRPELAEANRTMLAGINDLTKGLEKDDANKAAVAQFVYDELRQRQANELSPLESPILDSAGAMGYSWFLAANPAYILSNMFQPLQLSLPVLGGRHGYSKSSKAMFKATGVAFDIIKRTIGEGYQDNKWRGVLDANVSIDSAKATAGEKQALKALVASGQAEWTQAHELGRVTEGGSEKINTAAKLGGIMTHYGEALNRISTGLAAYNLEYSRTGDQAKAERYAIETVKNTQFDYSGHNRARQLSKHGMFGPVTPLVTAFMQFNVQTLELLARLGQQAFKGETAEARGEAKRALGGVMATTTMLAGTLGLPFAGLVSAAYNELFSDEDAPVDMVADYRNFLADTFGAETAELIAHGPLRATGLDVSSHLNFSNLIPGTQFLNDRRAVKDRLDSGALALLGPTVGAGAGIALGAEKMADGDFFGGLQKMVPTFLRAPLKAYDLATEGAKDSKGQPLPLDINGWDVASQALNYTPAKLAEQREAQRSVNTTAMLLKQRASNLQNKFIDALQEQDAESMASLMEQIQAFNATNPDFAIRNMRSIFRNRGIQSAVAIESGTAVQGRAKQLPRIQEASRFANTGGMVQPQ
jgi:hypothetical protein